MIQESKREEEEWRYVRCLFGGMVGEGRRIRWSEEELMKSQRVVWRNGMN